ncbi:MULTISPECIES: helix-turn-helix domain-containing protein [Rhodococcus]|uniref:helix-turn-helix domain-containing protein n=1 Tax=Rhodococcus TaxID=1827 RepID=UPI000C798B4F|nr:MULTISPECIES: helix-turn-helix domain-containing protein [Rhodococcus]AUM17200.1 DNA-binding protein [Rhodococcus ruber]
MTEPPLTVRAQPRLVAGLLLDTADARFLAACLEQLLRLLAERRLQPTPRVRALARLLTSATDSGRGTPEPAPADDLSVSSHELVDTVTAARILGCTPENVRSLCRRGRLDAQQAGGRWLIPVTAVHERRGMTA